MMQISKTKKDVVLMFLLTTIMSVLELEEAEKELMELDVDDDDDDDFEKVDKLTLPLVSKWNLPDGTPVNGLEVPVIKEDDFITDSMYRDDIVFGPTKDPPPHVFDSPPPPAHVCSICFKHWTLLHHFCCLPCGHIFGAQCIQKWLQTNLRGTCPQCNVSSSLEDVRSLYATTLCIPYASKGVVDPEISTRRFSFTQSGLIEFRKFEIGRRNFALKKRSDAKKRLAGVVGRKNDLMKRRTDLLDRRASVLNRAKALEQGGGSLCRADALRLRADALGRWADEYLRRAKACEERAKALSQRARAYNQRVKAFEVRLQYFYRSCLNLQKNTTHRAAEEDPPSKKEEEQVIEDVESDHEEEEESIDLRIEFEEDIEDEQEKEEEEKDDDEDFYKDLELLPHAISWSDPVTGKTNHGMQTMDVLRSTDGKRYEFHLCPICLKPWTLDKIHQMSCLPCGHMFGLSCLKDWMEGRSSDVCPRCYQNFSLETVRLLYATRLCIPAAAYRKTFVRRFPFSNFGFTAFKQYEPELRTNALNNRSDVLKQRADVLGRQNDAMKRRTELLNRMADAEKRADVLERQNDAMKRQIELLNRMTDEEDWAEAEKRAKVLRRLAGAMGQSADEYLRKADAFGQQGKALRQQAKSLRQLVDSYLATRKLYIQSYKEFLGLHDNNITE